jgi:hypothetical protein
MSWLFHWRCSPPYYLISHSFPALVRALWQTYYRQGILLKQDRSFRDICFDIGDLKLAIRSNDETPRRTLSGNGVKVRWQGMSATFLASHYAFAVASEKINCPFYLGCAKISEEFQIGGLHVSISLNYSYFRPGVITSIYKSLTARSNIEPCSHYCGNLVKFSLFFLTYFLSFSVYNHAFLFSVSLFFWILTSGNLVFHVVVIVSHFHTLNLKLSSA